MTNVKKKELLSISLYKGINYKNRHKKKYKLFLQQINNNMKKHNLSFEKAKIDIKKTRIGRNTSLLVI